MAATGRGLGRGLDALLKGYDAAQSAGNEPDVRFLSISAISPNENQPRKEFAQAALNELADSIRSQGVLQPILVRNIGSGEEQRFEIVAGERRWRASQLAGLTEMPVLVRDLSDEESLAIALIENLQREDLNPIEEALGLKELQQRFGLNQETLAQRIGKSRPTVANTMRLLQLPDNIQTNVREGHMSAGHARTLLAVTDPAAMEELRRRIVDDGLTVRDSETQSLFWKEHGHLPDKDSSAALAPRAATARKRAQQTGAIAEIGNRVAESLGLKVKITGSEEKGTLSIAFSSRDELLGLVSLFEEGQ